jgi:hypothetical protein
MDFLTAGVIGVVAIVFFVVVVPTLGYLFTQARAREHNAVLKRAMIEKGFTADEICRVIEAGPVEGKEKVHEAC